MTAKEVNAQTKDIERVVSVLYDFGDNLEEAVERYGAELVFNRYLGAVTIDLQAIIRRGIKGEKSDEEINQIVSEWRPGIKTIVRRTPQEKLQDAFSTMSAGDKLAALEQLKEMLAQAESGEENEEEEVA